MKKIYTNTMLIVSLVIFLSLLPTLFLIENTTYVVWTILIPLIPLIIIIFGYSFWRNICPLAFISKLYEKLNFSQSIEKRTIPSWLSENVYLFQFGLLFFSFCARLVFLNYNGVFLAIFFILVVLAAIIINYIYKGKVWCNYVCPVGIVEKIYSVSNSHNYNNSKCVSCTACTKNCPDIDLESSYWSEGSDSQKNMAFYSFSGLVLGFYLYFYLQTGSMDYYFSGDWSLEYSSLFSNGFYFAPSIPLILAAPITLLIFSFFSYLFFKYLEISFFKYKIFDDLDYKGVIHKVKVISAFVAFNIFYIFAGAPAYSNYPMFYAFFHFIVILSSAIMLHREIFREQSYFIQERFALKMLKDNNSVEDISKNLKEIYYTYQNKNRKIKLRNYKETVSDLLKDGILTQDNMLILEKLREQMGISEKEHINAIRKISIDSAYLFDENIEKSVEKRHQYKSYKDMLLNSLNENLELDNVLLESMRKQFNISQDDHDMIMDNIINSDSKLHTKAKDLLFDMQFLLDLNNKMGNDYTLGIEFLKFTIKNEFNKCSKDLFTLFKALYADKRAELKVLKKIFKYNDINVTVKCNLDMLGFMDREIGLKMLMINESLMSGERFESNENLDIILELIEYDNYNINIAILIALRNFYKYQYKCIDFTPYLESPDRELQQLTTNLITDTYVQTSYDRMAYFHHVPLFNSLTFSEYLSLAEQTDSRKYKEGEIIIKENERADSLYILTSGEVNMYKNNEFITTLNDGAFFGEISVITNSIRTATVKAISDIGVLVLSKKAFKNLIHDNPKISLHIMQEITKRLLQNKES